MPYPRVARSRFPRHPVDARALERACDADCAPHVRVAALWQLEGAVDDGTVAQRLGAILNEPSVVAFEAYECLASLALDEGSALDELAVGVDGAGVVVIPRARFAEHVAAADGSAWSADLDIPVVRLRDIQRLQARTAAPVVAWPRVIPEGHDLVVERTATDWMPARAVRLRGDDALVGGLDKACMKLPVPRRHIRYRRTGNGKWYVSDLYGEGLLTLADGRVLGREPTPLRAVVNVRADGDGEGTAVQVIACSVPRLDRSGCAPITLNITEHGRHDETLALGEALFLGPDDDDDYGGAARVRVVQWEQDELVVVAGAPEHGVVVTGRTISYADRAVRGRPR